jgi:type II secretory pathway pseudopilin PulG
MDPKRRSANAYPRTVVASSPPQMEAGKHPALSSKRQQGSIYVGVMVALAIVGIMLMEAGKMWSIVQQREREEQLLFAGDQIRWGLESYSKAGPASGFYPKTLDMLLQDSRQPTIVRYLRQVYADPMTGKPEWGVIPAEGGTIQGVYSQGNGTPLRQANFPITYQSFVGKGSYHDWVFLVKHPGIAKPSIGIMPPP